MMTSPSKLATHRAAARLGGSEARIAAQHAKGKRTARERIAALLDPDTFDEIGMFVTHRATGFGLEDDHPPGDGVVTGTGKIEGRPVCVFAQDFTVFGGSVGEAHGRKIARVMDMALQNGVPLIGLNDSGGARIQEGVDALAAYGEIFYRNVQASGVIPQISVILGPCAGGAVYSPAITDFVFMVEGTAHMFITGPDVIRTVTHEDVDFETLGGAGVHAARSGVAHFTAPDEDAVFAQLRWLLTYLPSNNLAPPPYSPTEDDPRRATPELAPAVPADPQQPYDIRTVIEALVDGGEFLEIQPAFAQNLVVGFARLDGHSVGIVANQPAMLAGVLALLGQVLAHPLGQLRVVDAAGCIPYRLHHVGLSAGHAQTERVDRGGELRLHRLPGGPSVVGPLEANAAMGERRHAAPSAVDPGSVGHSAQAVRDGRSPW